MKMDLLSLRENSIFEESIDMKNAYGVISALIILLASCESSKPPAWQVSNPAGSGTSGHQDGAGAAARFDRPTDVAVDSSGNVYVADESNHRIRKFTEEDDGTWEVSTLAGSGTAGYQDGAAADAQFNFPAGVAVDSSGNVYVADLGNHRIRKITQTGGAWTVSTLAGSGTAGYQDGAAASARFNLPSGVAVDSSGDVYVADRDSNRIRKITEDDGTWEVSTLAGSGTAGYQDGAAATAQFNFPANVAVDSSGNVYVADAGNGRIRKITEDDGTWEVSTLAGSGTVGYQDGAAAAAQFVGPIGVAVDSSGNVYVADFGNNRIRKITEDDGIWTVSTLAGGAMGYQDGAAAAAQFNFPFGVAVDSSGNVYVADAGNGRIRKITEDDGTWEVSTLAGSGTASYQEDAAASAQFSQPSGVAVDSSGDVYVADTSNHRIRKITEKDDGTWEVSTFAGSGTVGYQDGAAASARFYWPYGVAVDSSGNVYVAEYGNHRIRKITEDDGIWTVSTLAGSGTVGYQDGAAASAQFNGPSGVAVDSSGNVYVADGGNHRIRKITQTGGGTWTVSTLAGSGTVGYQDGAAASAQFNDPTGVAVDSSGNVYVADQVNHSIRKITEDDGIWTVSTLAGSGTAGRQNGAGAAAQFLFPAGVAVDSSGNVYVAEYGNHHIRKITEDDGIWTVSTLAGSGTAGYQNGAAASAQFSQPAGVAVDSSGNVYVADNGNHRIRKIAEKDDGAWTVGTIAGSGAEGYQDGAAASAQFNSPIGVAVDSSGNVYVADFGNNRIRKIAEKDGGAWTVSTLAGSGAEGYQDGAAALAQFNDPTGVALDSSGNVYVADESNHRIRKITEDDGIWTVSTLAGSGTIGRQDGAAASAWFNFPAGVALDSSGNVYVAEYGNHRIRKITEDDGIWTASTLAGSGTAGHQDGAAASAQFNLPSGVAVDSSGNVYVADNGNSHIRKITEEDGGAWTVSTLAGSGTAGHQNGAAATAQFHTPSGVALDSSGNVYVADNGNSRIRKMEYRVP